jgi:diguanylate cyclase (GGDEF)-like protein
MIFSEKTPYVLMMILSASISSAIAIRAYNSRREVVRAIPFAIMAAMCSFWMIVVTINTFTNDLGLKEVTWSLIPLAIFGTLIGLFFFSLEFSLRLTKVSNSIMVAPVSIALIIILLSATNFLHHQMWTVSRVNGNYIQVMGFFFIYQLAYTYILTISSMVLLIRAYLHSSGILRGQTVLLLIGILIPVLISIAADVFQWNPLPYVDEPAFSIVFTVIFFGWATLRFNTFYLQPVASNMIIKNMPEGVVVTDIEGLVIFNNPAAQQFLEKSDLEVNGHYIGDILKSWQPEALLAWEERKGETQLVNGKNGTQYIRLTISELERNSSESIGYLIILYNNTVQKNFETRLNELAICDPLTGSYNRRYFYEMANAYFNQMLRSSKPLSILMIDIDHFKNINDTYGHIKGDIVLQKVVSVCKSLVRNQDIFSRYGGEEFVLAMPETSLNNALIIAERLRKAIESLKNELGGITVSASIGIAESAAENDLSLDILLNRADEAMYLSKHKGRNQISVWEKPNS